MGTSLLFLFVMFLVGNSVLATFSNKYIYIYMIWFLHCFFFEGTGIPFDISTVYIMFSTHVDIMQQLFLLGSS